MIYASIATYGGDLE